MLSFFCKKATFYNVRQKTNLLKDFLSCCRKMMSLQSMFTRPGVAGAVLQTALSLINSLPHGLWNWGARRYPSKVLGEIRHCAKVYKSGEASRWRVCYQRGLPRLVLLWNKLKSIIYMWLAPFYLATEQRRLRPPVHLTIFSMSIFSWQQGSLLTLINYCLGIPQYF